MNSNNLNKFKVGDKVVALSGINYGCYKEGDIGEVTDMTTHAYPRVRFPTWHGWPLIGNVAPVASAKLALDNAHKAYKLEVEKAEGAKREAEKFTESDIKNLMVVRLSTASWLPDKYSLRVVTFSPSQAVITCPDGSFVSSCSREFLLSKLNAMYTKTNLTLKDFADAN